MILILPIHVHGTFFHLFVSSLISLSSILQFSLQRSFTSLVSYIPRYFILFVDIVNGIVLLMWVSAWLLVHRNASDFCTLILYPKALLKLLIRSRGFWAEALGFSRNKIVLSANRGSLTSSLLIWMPFISFSCLIALARTSSTMLNSSDRGHPCLVLVFMGNASSFCQFSMMLAMDLSQITLILNFILSMPGFLTWRKIEFQLRRSYGFCLQFCLGDDHIDLPILNQPCIPGIKPT